MSEWEENLPPRMREKLARIGEFTPAEKEKMKDLDQLASLLSGFYKGEITSEALWKELKDYRDKGKGYVLKEAQVKLIDSLSIAGDESELQKRRHGILAIETLKENQNTATIEQGLDMIERLRSRQKEEMEEAYNSLMAQVESNPQLRLQQVKQGQVMQLTVDEAIKTSPEWNNFIANHEKRYSQEFYKVVQNLKSEMR